MKIFNYELIDLILFDLQAFLGVVEQYNNHLGYLLYAFICLNILAVFLLKYFPRWGLYFSKTFLVIGWSVSGIFQLKYFISLNWVSLYIGYFCFFMAFLCLFSIFYFKVKSPSYWVFAFFTLTPTLVSVTYNSSALLTLGSSASLAALGGLSLNYNNSSKLSRILCLLNTIYLLAAGLLFWQLHSNASRYYP